MAVRLRLQGVDGFINYLRDLPEAVAHEVRAVVYTRADRANATVKGSYPARVTRKQLRSKFPPLASTMAVHGADASPTHPRAVLEQSSMLGRWYEVGTPDRYTKTGAWRGKMPAKPTFVPPAVAERREMYLDIESVLVEYGFTVTR